MHKTRVDVLEAIDKNRGKKGIVSLNGWDLSGEDLSDLDLSYVEMEDANLSKCDLTATKLLHTEMRGANTEGIKFYSIKTMDDKQYNDVRDLIDSATRCLHTAISSEHDQFRTVRSLEQTNSIYRREIDALRNEKIELNRKVQSRESELARLKAQLYDMMSQRS
jgi:hypothetical protein